MENRNWKEGKSSELIDLISGFAFKSANFLAVKTYNTLPIIKIKNVANGDVNLNDVVYHEYNDKLSNYIIEKGDVLIAMTGNHIHAQTQIVGDVSLYKLDEPVLLNQRVGKFVAKENTDLKFVYYLFKDEETRFNLANKASGSANQANISKSDILDLEISIPPLPEQKAIASVLSSLDDKIDLLHQQNQTLEALAETLFRQWFIVDAKEDWEVLPLNEIAEVKNGKSFKSSDFTDNDFNSYEVVKMGHIERGGGLKLNPKKDFVSREMDVEKWILNKGDIIMAMTDMKDNVVILGVPAMIDKDDHYVLNQRVARIYLKDNSKLISNYLLYIQLNNKDFIAELQTKANSGVQVNLSTEAIKESEVLIPPIELQKEFGHKIIDLYSKIEINREQIQTITQLRDTLLPKLMGGEVRLKM